MDPQLPVGLTFPYSAVAFRSHIVYVPGVIPSPDVESAGSDPHTLSDERGSLGRTKPGRTKPGRSAGRPLRQRRDSAFALLLVIPALLTFAVVALYPLVNSIQTAFLNESLVAQGASWAGFNNFVDAFNGDFWASLGRTVVFSIGATALSFVVGLALALVLNTNLRGRSVLRGILILPWVLPGVVVSFLWAWIFNANYGVLNAALDALGLGGGDTAWLGQAQTAMIAVIIAKAWMSFPWIMVMMLAGLQAVPGDLVEAAAIDGAGKWRTIRSIKLPHLRSIIYVVLLLEISYNFQHFDTLYVMTGGGPGKATSTLALEVYNQAFKAYDLGHAAAIGVLWLLVLAVPSAVYLWLSRREEAAR